MEIIIAPIISEQSMQDASNSKFTFKVVKTADKTAIKKAVEGKFNVSVVAITTRIMKGKSKRFGARRAEIAAAHWKKAVVKLKKGEKIALFDLEEKK